MSRAHIAVLMVFVSVLFAPLLWQRGMHIGPKGAEQKNVAQETAVKVVRQCTLEIEIDARDMFRGLLHASIRMPVKDLFAEEIALPVDVQIQAESSVLSTDAGTDTSTGQKNSQQTFYRVRFPEWIPGIHAPRGAIQNMAGFVCTDDQGNVLSWYRDPLDVYAFLCSVPSSTEFLHIDFDYLCNQPSVNSRGVDSFADRVHGIMSWNDVVVYPDVYNDDEIHVRARILLPEGWSLASALTHAPVPTDGGQQDAWIAFDVCDLRTCIDSPVIMGKYMKTYQLSDGGKDVRLHCVGDSEKSIRADEAFLTSMKKMVIESRLLFGEEHYRAYDFLLACSDAFPRLGLEHLESSLNGVGGNDLAAGGRAALRVMSHEYMHSWCGKHRRPQGMYTQNFHDAKETTLLWIYEGLTQYLGKVIGARSGMMGATNEMNTNSTDKFQQMILAYAKSLRYKNGRRWRSLADTATASYLLRGGSRHWSNWLRGQDYYIEGALIWFEVDTILRQQSQDSKKKLSIDDFARIFLGNVHSERIIDPFSYDDVLNILQDLTPYAWREFFERRVYQPQQEFDLGFLQHSGWEIVHVEDPDVDDARKWLSYRSAYESIGLGMSARGRIYRVLRDSPAYHAGLARNMQIIKINGTYVSPAVLHQALKDSPQTLAIVFTLEEENTAFTRTVEYAGGARYLSLRRVAGTTDRIQEITTSLTSQETPHQNIKVLEKESVP